MTKDLVLSDRNLILTNDELMLFFTLPDINIRYADIEILSYDIYMDRRMNALNRGHIVITLKTLVHDHVTGRTVNCNLAQTVELIDRNLKRRIPNV